MRPTARATVTVALTMVAVVALSGAPARAHTETIRIASLRFQPALLDGLTTNPLDPAGRHPIVWHNDGNQAHQVREAPNQEGIELSSGHLSPDERSPRNRLWWAATWRYVCIIHPSMEGTIKVKPALHPAGEPGNAAVTQGPGGTAVLRLGNEALPDNYVMDVHQRRDDGSWRRIRERISRIRVRLSPNEPGVYRYRTRIFHLSSGSVTSWSPVSRPLTVA